MKLERWRLAEELFHRAADLSPEARAALLASECAGDDDLRASVERLLEADHGEDDLIDRWDERGPLGPTDVMVGTQVGAYRLISRIAAGGMGVVYRAARIDGLFDHEVAVKLIRSERATASMVKRFELERRTLAALNHPNIAALHDGGTTDGGLPYLVMELVHGVPIDRHCNERRLGVEERLRLFAQVCRAVQFAHRNLVVHRDLKPSNILIDAQGEPKLLDFGIARLLDDGAAGETRTMVPILTPEYASPEQVAGGPTTTAIDVYSLGVVLYELLTGQKPLQIDSRSPLDWSRIVSEHTPTRPSTAVIQVAPRADDAHGSGGTPQVRAAHFGSTPSAMRRRLRGDLDRIVLMAIRKEPERRYTSAQEFAEDIERHLACKPVLARQDSIPYRASRFVQRNKLGVASAAAVALALVVGVVTAYRGERHAQHEAAHASVEAESFQDIAEFLMDTFLSSTAARDEPRLRAAHQRVLQHAERVRRQYAEEDHLRANLLDALGRVCLRVDMFADADGLIEEALEIRARAFGRDSLEFALSLRSAGLSCFRQGDFSRAAADLKRALELHRTCALGVHTDVAGVANDLAACLRNLGRGAEAEALHREALAIRRANPNGALPVAESLNNLAGIHLERGEHAPAADLLVEALEIRRSILGSRDLLTLQTSSNLASALWPLDRREDALRLLEEAESGYRSLRADGVEGLGRVLSNLAAFQIGQGELQAAEANLAEALDLQHERLGETHPIVLAILTKLAVLQHERGENHEARATWERIVDAQLAAAPSDRSLARTLHDYGVFLVNVRALDEAHLALTEALSLLSEDPSPLELGRVQLALGMCLSGQRRPAEALDHLQQAAALLEQALPAGELELRSARQALEELRADATLAEQSG